MKEIITHRNKIKHMTCRDNEKCCLQDDKKQKFTREGFTRFIDQISSNLRDYYFPSGTRYTLVYSIFLHNMHSLSICNKINEKGIWYVINVSGFSSYSQFSGATKQCE